MRKITIALLVCGFAAFGHADPSLKQKLKGLA
jgi:hypothetical protein